MTAVNEHVILPERVLPRSPNEYLDILVKQLQVILREFGAAINDTEPIQRSWMGM